MGGKGIFYYHLIIPYTAQPSYSDIALVIIR